MADDEQVEEESTGVEETTDGPKYWQYVGWSEKVYPHVPVTVNRHDVIEWHELPADDGEWRVCDSLNIENGDFAVKLPDNAPQSTVDDKNVEE